MSKKRRRKDRNRRQDKNGTFIRVTDNSKRSDKIKINYNTWK